MSGKAVEQIQTPDPSCSSILRSHISDDNDTENDHLQSKNKGKQDDGENLQRVPPLDGVNNSVPAGSREDTTSGFSLARILQSWAPNVYFVLENTGSVARDHLANERTWLAYVRTSLSIAGTGVALVQLFTISESIGHATRVPETGVSLRQFARPLGATTVLLALFILGIGVMRYFKVQTALTQGHFCPARGTVVIITAALAGLVAVTFGVLAALPS